MENEPANEEPEAIEEKTLTEWEAADRPYKKRGIGYFFNIVLIAVIVFLVLFFFRQYILIAVLFSLVFVGITLATVPARTISYKVSNKGIRISQYMYTWDKLTEFWYDKILGHEVIIIGTTNKLQPRLTIMYDTEKRSAIVDNLKKYIKEVAPPKPTWLDKRSQDLAKLANIGQK